MLQVLNILYCTCLDFSLAVLCDVVALLVYDCELVLVRNGDGGGLDWPEGVVQADLVVLLVGEQNEPGEQK